MPITLEGRFVAAAIFVMDIEEVFVARIQLAGAASSISLKIFSLRVSFSVAASTISCAFFTPAATEVLVVIFCKQDDLSSSEMVPFANCLSRWSEQSDEAVSRETRAVTRC